MTKSEYRHLYAQARSRGAMLTRAAMRELRSTYVAASDIVASVVRDAELRGLSELTSESRRAVQLQLEAGANSIRTHVGEVIPETVRRQANVVSSVDSQYLIDAMDGQGLLNLRPGVGISAVGIRMVASGVNDRVVAATINRVWQDGYRLSERVWNTGLDYQTQINRVVSAGFAQGRDPVKIAADIEQYVRKGKRSLAQRYGPELTADTRRFMRRIRQNVDYRALRLVRSELYASLQDAGRESGRANPGAQDFYDWILEPNRQQWNCECPSLADGGPYHYHDVPSYPHSNCGCRVQAILMDSSRFNDDLKTWSDGGSVPYLDQWYREFYVPAVG